jgi:predicted phosphodiesterase
MKDDNYTKECDLLRVCFQNMEVDALALCGDITENGFPEEWDTFFDIFNKHCRTKNLFLVPGNMDNVYNPEGKQIFLDIFQKQISKCDNIYFTYETENCFLIGISPEQKGEITISDMQLTNLDKSLKKAAENNIPAFIFSHYQLSQTIDIDWKYANLGSESENIRSILEKHNGKVLFFSGHTHRGLIKQIGGSITKNKNVTYISTPSICKPDIEHYRADNDNIGTGYILELSKDIVHIRGFDFFHKTWLEDFNWTV